MNNNDIVFDALRICITEGKCTNTDCPYEMFCKFNGKEQYVQIPKALALDVLNELKEQEAKYLTKCELTCLSENQFVWIEFKEGNIYCLEIIGICQSNNIVTEIQFNSPTAYIAKSTTDYGNSYRIWTNRPTDEQRKEVKWK